MIEYNRMFQDAPYVDYDIIVTVSISRGRLCGEGVGGYYHSIILIKRLLQAIYITKLAKEDITIVDANIRNEYLTSWGTPNDRI